MKKAIAIIVLGLLVCNTANAFFEKTIVDKPKLNKILNDFDHNASWDYNENTNLSKSINSPWMDWSIRGKVEGIVVGCETNILL